MKAAVLYEKGGRPQYEDFITPVPANGSELIMTVKAAAIKNVDRSIASGKHYSNEYKNSQPGQLIGSDAVGLLEDGTVVYAVGKGMVAEKAIVDKDRMVKVPAGLDYATAAAVPNAVFGAAMGLLCRADMQKGSTVLINGATGFTGKMAVQLAKHYGAGRIIATGRNEKSLASLKTLGADETISLHQTDENFISQIDALHKSTPIDIVIDYLWGRPAEMILSVLKGTDFFTHPTKFISVGSMAGNSLPLSAAILRSADLQISGSGLGSWTKMDVARLFKEILPEVFELARTGKIKADTVTVSLKDIELAYDLSVDGGKRMVVMI